MNLSQKVWLCAAAAVLFSGSLLMNAGSKETKVTTRTTTTIVSETTVKEKTANLNMPMKVCVLDFTTIDIKGQKRFLSEKNKPISIPQQSTLTDADRKSVNSVMQGCVKMIDAWDNSSTNDANRDAQVDDNRFDRAKALDLYNTTLKGETRPVVIGAEYLSAYLGKHSNVFSCMDSGLIAAAMQKLQKAPDFPKDFMLRLAKESGATHLIYGTVSDIRTQTKSFKGYGIITRTTNYELDVIIKLVDLAKQRSIYSNVHTSSYREQRPYSEGPIDNNIFQNLMKTALEQAADDLYVKFSPDSED